MKKEELKEKAFRALEENRDKLIEIQEQIKKNPEYGYKEVFATDLIKKELTSLGLRVESPIAITGCRAFLNDKKNGPKVAVMGEMDAVTCKEHPFADPETGASHSCGHSIQSTVMLGVAMALVKSGIYEHLDGQIDFFALPAEEYIELDYRTQLREKGNITYYGGKQELIYRGAFDDIDMVLMMHSHHLNGKKVQPSITTNGFIGKQVNYIGRAAHAGGSPYLGVNALNAITLGLQAVHSNRETFRDEDHIRFHPIVTQGGLGVNTVPDHTALESYIRGVSLDTIVKTNKTINRALISGALAVGAQVEIQDTPGYLPFKGSSELEKIFENNMRSFLSPEDIASHEHYAFSLDIGDVSHLIPTLHPLVGGVTGELHAKEFAIIDIDNAILLPIKGIIGTVIDLLYDNAKEAKSVKENFVPLLNKKQYIETLDHFFTKKTYDPAKELGL